MSSVIIRRARRFGLSAWLCGLALIAGANAAEVSELTDFGSNPGRLQGFLYRPDNRPANAPLLVALHGCRQTAVDYAVAAGWRQYADRWGFVLLLPQQRQANNRMGCFNWFRPEQIGRDRGEALSIREMIQHVQEHEGIDPTRIYIAGLSAGGAMTAALLAAYPDVFAGGAIVAGVPYSCARGLLSAWWGQLWGCERDPADWGGRVRQSAQDHHLTVVRWPRVSIWQGAADRWVRPSNAEELLEQWTDVHGIDRRPDVDERAPGYSHRVYRDVAGAAQVELYWITGLGHGQPIAPGVGETNCGTPAPYILPAGVCASYYIGRFFQLDAPASSPRPTPTPSASVEPRPCSTSPPPRLGGE